MLTLLSTHSLYDIKALFAAFARGDEPAFRSIFDLFKHKVQAIALKLLRDPEDANEIVQEVFLKIWVSQEKFTDIEDPEAYLFTTVYNSIYTWMRKAANEEKLLAHLLTIVKTEQALCGEDVVIAKETKAIIDEVIQSLPPQRQLIFKLSRQEGLTYDQIAHQLNLSPHTVHNQVGAALQAIRNCLSKAALSLLFLLWSIF